MSKFQIKEVNALRSAAQKLFRRTNEIIEQAEKSGDMLGKTELYKLAMENNRKAFELETKAHEMYLEYLEAEKKKLSQQQEEMEQQRKRYSLKS